jgi:hypothetical protein
MHEKKFFRTLKRLEPIIEQYRQEYFAAGKRFHDAENMIGNIYLTYICKSCGSVEHLSYASTKSKCGSVNLANHLCPTCARKAVSVEVFSGVVITKFTRGDGRVIYEFNVEGKVHKVE